MGENLVVKLLCCLGNAFFKFFVKPTTLLYNICELCHCLFLIFVKFMGRKWY